MFSRSILLCANLGIRNYSTVGGEFLKTVLQKEISTIKDAGTYKTERIITSAQSPVISVTNKTSSVLNFCANNYLGLADNPEIINAAKGALDSHGAGLSSVRFICGTQDIHKLLEKNTAKFHQMEDCIVYPSCFDANAGLFEGILTAEDAVISDELNHASIIDGIRLCKAKRYRYKHMNIEDLEAKLREADSEGARVKLVVTDGVFSMDGDVAPLDKIVPVCEKYKAVIMIDECHATGFFGPTGRGTPEYFGVMDKIDIINSTFGKALGGASGGYTTGSREVVDILRQRGRPYLFSNSLAPSVVATGLKALELIDRDPTILANVKRNTKLFRERMTAAGFTISGQDHPICPVMIYDARKASEFADSLLEKGIYVIGFSFPVVPKGLARIRVQISARHTVEQVNQAVDAFIEIGKQKGIIN